MELSAAELVMDKMQSLPVGVLGISIMEIEWMKKGLPLHCVN